METTAGAGMGMGPPDEKATRRDIALTNAATQQDSQQQTGKDSAGSSENGPSPADATTVSQPSTRSVTSARANKGACID